MLPKDHSVFKTYFNKCKESDAAPSFEGFIRQHSNFLRVRLGESQNDYEIWHVGFKNSARHHKLKAVTGNAKKAWNELVAAKPLVSKKRSFMTANVINELDGLNKDLASDSVIASKFNEIRSQMVFHLKTRQTSSISAELEKLMIVQGVMKLDKTPSLFMENEFGRRVVSKFAREKRQELYGRPAKLPAAFVNSIKDALEYFDEDRNQKSLKKKLALMIEEDDQKERILDVLVLIFHQLTVKKKANDEMRLQSGLISALCNLFKATEFHDPQGYNKILFPACPALKDCRPDFVVEVDDDKSYVNLVGEIKGDNSCKDRLALDAYRLGAFGLHMLWSYQLKHSLVFMAEGLKVTFFVCCVSSGICLMTEVDCLNLPSTFDEFVDFGSQVDKLYNLACLYDQHCVPGDAVYEQWSLLSYDAIKLTYDLHTTTKASTAKVDNSPEAASSTEVCL